jgi:hypothetical protein
MLLCVSKLKCLLGYGSTVLEHSTHVFEIKPITLESRKWQNFDFKMHYFDNEATCK